MHSLLKHLYALILLIGCVLLLGQDNAAAQSNFADAAAITAGRSTAGKLSTPVEVDYYKLKLDKNGYIEIGFDAPESGEWKITLMNSGKNEMFSRSSKESTVKIGVKSGEYYISVAPIKYSAEKYTLTAGFKASEAWESEFNDSAEKAGAISAKKAVTGNLSTARDIDCYSFSLSEPRYVSINFTTSAKLSNEAWALTVLDEADREVIYSSLSKSAETEPTALDAGKYIVEITAINHSSKDYTLKLNVADTAVITRMEGANRIQTAIGISREGWAYGTAGAAVLANAYNYPDALAGVSLAYALNAPILLTSGEELEPEVIKEIERLGTKNIYILGGESVVSEDIAKILGDEGYKVTRLAGKDRFGTSLEIAKKLQSIAGKPSEIFFVYSHNYPDALAISGVAAAKKCPVVYIADTGKLTDGIASFVKSSGAKTATIISGPAIVSSAAEKNIKKAGVSDTNRIYGANRYETCIKINEAYAKVLTGKAVCVATGTNYPDALAGGVFAANQKAPMLLVDKSLTASQTKYLKSKDAENIYVFGGTGVVSDKLANEIAKY